MLFLYYFACLSFFFILFLLTCFLFFFFFNDTATTEIYTLSLHDALPISPSWWSRSGSSAAPAHTSVLAASAGRSSGWWMASLTTGAAASQPAAPRRACERAIIGQGPCRSGALVEIIHDARDSRADADPDSDPRRGRP